MVGRTLGELSDLHWSRETSSKHSKSGAGAIVERYFNIKQNSESAPDFPGAGIELKVCPLVMDGDTARRIKERTSVTMIDYMALDHETWPTASVHKKIEQVLFVFYEWRPDTPLGDMRVRSVKIWSPPESLKPQMEQDWLAVWAKNREGRADEISESDGQILGSATKGATGGVKKQPHNPEPARSRAWSLKPKLTWTIFAGTQGDDEESERLVRELRAEAPIDPVDALLGRVEPLVGQSIAQLVEQHALKPDNSKNRVSNAIRRAVGLSPKKLPKELEALGLEFKTTPLGPGAEPHEAMSFPAFDPRELVGEEWEDSDLLASVQNMLIVPIYRAIKKSDLMEQRICRPFRWQAEREQLAQMRGEWERYRDMIAQGRWDRMPPESETRTIHIRPHGMNKHDLIQTADGTWVKKQCFWLNREFVRELVLAHNTDWQGF
jgi:DNA mismatch repair endonuclease MutH